MQRELEINLCNSVNYGNKRRLTKWEQAESGLARAGVTQGSSPLGRLKGEAEERESRGIVGMETGQLEAGHLVWLVTMDYGFLLLVQSYKQEQKLMESWITGKSNLLSYKSSYIRLISWPPLLQIMGWLVPRVGTSFRLWVRVLFLRRDWSLFTCVFSLSNRCERQNTQDKYDGLSCYKRDIH